MQILFEGKLAFWIKLFFSFKNFVASNIFFINFKELSSNLVFCLLEIQEAKENRTDRNEQALKATNVTKKHESVVYIPWNFS